MNGCNYSSIRPYLSVRKNHTDFTALKKRYSSYYWHAYGVLATLLIGILAFPIAADASGKPCKEKKIEECKEADKPFMTREFSMSGPGVMKAYTPAGNIAIQSISGTDKVRVELYVDRGYAFWSNDNNLDNYRIRMFQRGNEVVASVERKGKETGFFSDKVTFSYKIYVPACMSTELKTSGGNVELAGLNGDQLIKSNGGNISASRINGKLAAYTAGGNISVNESNGIIYLKTTGGNITVDEGGGELRLESYGGRITAERISGTLLAKLAAGDIKAQFIEVAKGISLETTSGNIFLEIPEMPGYDIILKGSEVEMPNTINFSGTRDSHRIEGQIYEGGVPINLTTSVGKIVLKTR